MCAEKKKQNIILKLEKSGLSGRSGSGFPVWRKWQAAKKAKGEKKYVVCNASEGELGSHKDAFLLEEHADEVIEGIKLAMQTIGSDTGYIYLKKDYYDKFSEKLSKLTKGTGIILFKKPAKYIAGEETAICEVIEGKPAEPRKKPPYITEKGIFGCPTLLNNVETFYYAAKVAKDEYKNTKFYSIVGDIKNPGTYELSEKANIIDILKETGNIPESPFFVKAGGGACGRILLERELKQPLCGLGSLIVYEMKKTNLISLAKEWIEFLESGNCKKCVPCREGLYRLKESIKEGRIDEALFKDLFFVLENTSFCALGRMAPSPFKDLLEKFHGKI